jgi:hypothetical protein
MTEILTIPFEISLVFSWRATFWTTMFRGRASDHEQF